MKKQLTLDFCKDEFIKKLPPNTAENPALLKELEEVIEHALPLITPLGYVVESPYQGSTEKPNTYAEIQLDCIITLGKEYELKKQDYLAQGDYLRDYLLDTLCDYIIFKASSQLYQILRATYKTQGLSLSYRQIYENDAIVEQKPILERVRTEHPDIDITITEGFMYSPVKSMGYRYFVGKNIEDSGIDQCCDGCSNRECSSRLVNVLLHMNTESQPLNTTKTGQSQVVYTDSYGTNLLSMVRGALGKAGNPTQYEVHADCGSRGTCGACKIKIITPLQAYPAKEEEIKLLSKQELESGVRLGCLHTVRCTTHIEVPKKNLSDQGVVHDFALSYLQNSTPLHTSDTSESYCFAIDIGTTTLVVAMVDSLGNIVDRIGSLNPQKSYGADIMSRIAHANKEGHAELTALIRSALSSLMNTLYARQPLRYPIDKIVISGNTTMAYLLMGEHPKPLGESPYIARETDIIQKPTTELFTLDFKVKETTIIPWLSAFVGGDILGGIYFTQMLSFNKTQLLLDIGTNGEIALVKEGKIYTTSTAAGPALEGSNIIMGMGSLDGAIYEISADGYKSFGNEDPIGVCGTGIIDALALALADGRVDTTGRLENPIHIAKSVYLYPEDIRQIQLAKGAIAAGIKTVLESTNTSYQEVESLYISGGFGLHLNKQHALAIGLIPKELGSVIRVLGNSSLAGCVRYILDGTLQGNRQIEEIQEANTSIDLSTNPIFHNHYMNEMMF